MICEKCGKEFTEDWRADKRGECRFCSKGCSNSRNHSVETKQKISKTLNKHINKLIKEKKIPEKKFCSKCGKKVSHNNKSGFCFDCRNTSKSNADSVREWRKRKKFILVEYKGGKCKRCGYDKCIEALEFHHKDPSKKDFGISGKNIRSIERCKEEIDKCILLCANCHREIHEEERKNKKF